MTINVMENVRKMRGWCPNMSSMGKAKAVDFEEGMMSAPDSDNKL